MFLKERIPNFHEFLTNHNSSCLIAYLLWKQSKWLINLWQFGFFVKTCVEQIIIFENFILSEAAKSVSNCDFRNCLAPFPKVGSLPSYLFLYPFNWPVVIKGDIHEVLPGWLNLPSSFRSSVDTLALERMEGCYWGHGLSAAINHALNYNLP